MATYLEEAELLYPDLTGSQGIVNEKFRNAYIKELEDKLLSGSFSKK